MQFECSLRFTASGRRVAGAALLAVEAGETRASALTVDLARGSSEPPRHARFGPGGTQRARATWWADHTAVLGGEVGGVGE
eukprot:3653352-Prymnesium_polylepis.1